MRETSANETIPAPVIKTPAATPRASILDRSCDVVIHGIKESPSSTKRPDRQKAADLDNIMHTLLSANIPV